MRTYHLTAENRNEGHSISGRCNFGCSYMMFAHFVWAYCWIPSLWWWDPSILFGRRWFAHLKNHSEKCSSPYNQTQTYRVPFWGTQNATRKDYTYMADIICTDRYIYIYGGDTTNTHFHPNWVRFFLSNLNTNTSYTWHSVCDWDWRNSHVARAPQQHIPRHQ